MGQGLLKEHGSSRRASRRRQHLATPWVLISYELIFPQSNSCKIEARALETVLSLEGCSAILTFCPFFLASRWPMGPLF